MEDERNAKYDHVCDRIKEIEAKQVSDYSDEQNLKYDHLFKKLQEIKDLK